MPLTVAIVHSRKHPTENETRDQKIKHQKYLNSLISFQSSGVEEMALEVLTLQIEFVLGDPHRGKSSP